MEVGAWRKGGVQTVGGEQRKNSPTGKRKVQRTVVPGEGKKKDDI